MTTPVCVRQRIRQLDRQGLTHKEISRRLGVSRTTVARYANHGDYSPRPSNTADGAGRWSMTGTRPSWMAGRPPVRACRSSSAIPRPARTRGSWRNAGSRARIRRRGAGPGVGGRSIAHSRTASPNWIGVAPPPQGECGLKSGGGGTPPADGDDAFGCLREFRGAVGMFDIDTGKDPSDDADASALEEVVEPHAAVASRAKEARTAAQNRRIRPWESFEDMMLLG